MLTVSNMGSGQGGYYTSLATEDYYISGGEPPGSWYGEGAAAIGLSGVVQKDDLTDLLCGMLPGGEKSLVRQARYRNRVERQPGWDLTFSAPKSVSVLWSQLERRERRAVEKAHDAAVRVALSYLEEVASYSRRGAGGAILEPAKLIAAIFQHGTSRALDPQLHSHALVVNGGVRADGSTGAIRSRDLYRHQLVGGVVYRAELARQLRSRGLELKLSGTSFEIAAVPDEIVEFFSKRRAEIEVAMKNAHTSGARAAEVAALATRKTKHGVNRKDLFRSWRADGKALGFSAEQIPISPGDTSHSVSVEIIRESLSQALDDITRSQAFFPERELLRVALLSVQHLGVDIELARRVLSGLLKDRAVTLELLPDGPYGQYTTREMFEVELDMLRLVARLDLDRETPIAGVHVEKALSADPDLRDEQRVAVEGMVSGQGAIQCVVGVAGAGKTRAVSAAKRAWDDADKRVIGCALSARAGRELEQASGISSYTLERLFRGVERGVDEFRFDSDTVVVLDEAGMVDTRRMKRLLSMAEEGGARVVLLGDPRQLQPIEAGGPFRAITELIGAVEIRKIIRQEQEWMRDAVYDFLAGQAESALNRYEEAGRLRRSEERGGAVDSLVDTWAEERTEDLSQCLILVGTNEDVREINIRCQEIRSRAGELAERPDEDDGYREFLRGDRVLFTRNDPRLGVLNGDFGCVTSIDGAQVLVELDDDQGSGRSRRRVALSLDEYPFLQLGYAATTHKAQGATVDKTFVLAGGWMVDREAAYSQMSRARLDSFVFAWSDPLARVVRDMSRSRPKLMAHDVAPESEPIRPRPGRAA